jgi:diguanylate cyclase (GGDEF)-like protein
VHAALGHYREAMRDQATFLRLYKEQQVAERNLQAAVLRAQFETDRQLERNTALQQALDLNGGRLRSMIYAAVAGGVILLLLVYLLAANRRQARQLARLADTDALTGLPNRRRTAELVQRLIERAARDGTAVTIAIIDIDHFKSINDRFGHATGDRVLGEFARIARESLRESDLIGRWGGEEFLAAMPDTELDVASKVMERVRTKLTAMPDHTDSPGLCIRASVGLATSGEGSNALDHIVAQADIALYQAKHAGRDTLRIAQQSYDAASTSVRKALHGAGLSMTTGRFRRLLPDAEMEQAG